MVLRPIDFGPGQDHIYLKQNNFSYYVPELFHLNESYKSTVPLLINDIHKLKSMIEIYGARGNKNTRIGCRLIGNHPIKRVKILGRLVGATLIEKSGGINQSIVFISIDDTSGDNLIIQVTISLLNYLGAGLSIDYSFGKIVVVIGQVNEFRNKLEINSEYCRCVGDKTDIDLELHHWKDCLRYRDEVLSIPWQYRAPAHLTTEFQQDPPPYKRDERYNIIGSQVLTNNDHDINDDNDNYDINDDNNNHINPIETRRIKPLSNSPVKPLPNCSIKPYQECGPLNSNCVPVITRSQVTLEMIRYILRNQCRNMKLIDIYQDDTVSRCLNDLTIQQVSLRGPGIADDFLVKKHEIFHSIRHSLQVDFKLLKTTKKQLVKPDNLKKLSDHIQGCINSIKNYDGKRSFDVPNYLRLYKHSFKGCLGDHVNYKLVNSIVEWFVGSDDKWRYDKERIEWSYNPI